MGPSKALLQAIAVTAELTGTELSPAAAKVMATDLAAFPEPQVIGALTRCRRELKGRMTVADVLTRLEDGRPGPEEAWSMIPKSEAATVVWTDEMSQAMAVAGPLMDSPVQARMAFLEKYRELVRQAREDKRPPCWWVSLGHDVLGREGPVLEAVERGRLTVAQASNLLPSSVSPDVLARIGAASLKALEAA